MTEPDLAGFAPYSGEPLTEDTIQANAREYAEAQRDYRIALTELWAGPRRSASLAAQTAVVLGKLLHYQEAYKVMLSNDALFLRQTLTEPEAASAAGLLLQRLFRKLDQVSQLEEGYRADRVLYCALVIASRDGRS